MDIEKIRKDILAGKEIEEVLKNLDWKDFEEFVVNVFSDNNFVVKRNFRFKTKRRYEIDIVASRGNSVVCVDCKEWSKGRYKKSGLKHAVKNQENRVKEFKKFLKKNLIAQNVLKIEPDSAFYPLIVTLFEEDLIIENNTFIVPVWKLNGFLLELEKYMDL
jgi:Holliday junction resolvase-like predicted endonuclease